jgi:hypothetical protein
MMGVPPEPNEAVGVTMRMPEGKDPIVARAKIVATGATAIAEAEGRRSHNSGGVDLHLDRPDQRGILLPGGHDACATSALIRATRRCSGR